MYLGEGKLVTITCNDVGIPHNPPLWHRKTRRIIINCVNFTLTRLAAQCFSTEGFPSGAGTTLEQVVVENSELLA